MVIALVDLFKRENMTSNTRLVWAFVIIINQHYRSDCLPYCRPEG